MKRSSTIFLAVACTALLVAGCGSSKKSSSSSQSSTQTQAPAPTSPSTTSTAPSGGAPAGGGKGSKLKLSADPSGQFKFDKSSLTAKAGSVTLTMTNPSSVPHAIAVEGNGVDQKGPTAQTSGSTSAVTVSLKPGKYTFYCPVDGHRQAGMQGTLTVK